MNEANTTARPSLDVLYATYHTRIYQRVYHLVRHPEDAEDLTQDVFLRAHRALPVLKNTDNLYGWLYRIATNVALDALRRRKLMVWQSLEPLAWTVADRETADPQTAYSGAAGLVTETLERLAPQHRQALLLRAAGYSNAELAQAASTSLHTINCLTSRARASFQEHYQQVARHEERSR